MLPASSSFHFPIECILAKQISSLPPGQCVEILDLLCQYFVERTALDTTHRTGNQPTDKDLSSPKKSPKSHPLSLSEPLVIKLIPSLEKAADIVRVFLSHIPSITWTGRYREKAVRSLLRLHTKVCLPSLNANYAEVFSSLLTLLLCTVCLNFSVLVIRTFVPLYTLQY